MKMLIKFLGLCYAVVFMQANLQAQCNFSGTGFGVAMAANTCGPVTITTTAFYSEYSTVNGLTIGRMYTFTANATAGVAPYSLNVYTSTTPGGAPVAFTNSATRPLSVTFTATTTTAYVKNFDSSSGPCSSPSTPAGGHNTFTINCNSCPPPAAPPICPGIFTPVAGATGVSLMPKIDYSPITGAVSYNIYLQADPTCTTSPTTLLVNTTALSYTLTTPLNPLTQYGIRVVAINCGGVMSADCAERCFTTGNAPSSNDNCAGAGSFPVSPNSACSFTSVSTAGATQSTPNPLCTGVANNDDIWYTFTTGLAGGYAFTYNSLVAVTGSATTIGLDLYTGTCGALTAASACTNGYGAAGAGTMTLTLFASTTYYLRLFTTGPSNSGTFNFCVRAPAPPSACVNGLGAGTVYIDRLPYDGTGLTTCGNGNNVNTGTATICGDAAYYGAADKIFIFTPVSTDNYIISVNATGENQRVGLMLYNGCPFTGGGGACVGYVQSNASANTLTVTLTSGITYYLVVDNFPTSGCLSNFDLTIDNFVLPLELKSFTGQAQAAANLLNWETLTEKNVQFHVVERSADGARWSEVGRVNGKEDSQVSTKYSLTDNAPLARAYYRLRSIDFDGKENLSNSIVLTHKGENFGITSVYPSPTTDNVTVQFNSTSEEKVMVRVMDMQGRLVMQQVMEAVKDINELPITLTGLQAGVYSVTVSKSTGISAPVRFVKQ